MISGNKASARPLWHAPELATAGYPVFPTDPSGKQPTVEGGFYAATKDHSQIAEWIQEKRRERDNVAFPTGAISGVVVIDADTPEAAERMRVKYGPPTVESVHAHKGGGHWYFRHPRNGKVASSGGIQPGLDRKGDGGYVLAPPSKGKTWTSGLPEIASLPVLPEEFWSKGKDTPRREGAGVGDEIHDKAVEAIARHVARVGSGRHDHMLCACAVFAKKGMAGEGEDILIAAWEQVGGDLADRASTEIPNAMRTTEAQIAAGENVRGGPSMEKVTPGLYDELSSIFGWKKKYEGVVSDDAIGTGPARRYALTDTGNGERFAAQHGGDARWVKRWKTHMVWDGRKWGPDYSEDITRRAQRTAKRIHAEAANPDLDKEEQRNITKWAMSSQSAERIRAMVELAKPHMIAMHDDFDADPWLLNCQNGIVDLRTGELREHDRQALITKATPVEYDPTAEAPVFHAFLEKIIPQPEVRAFLQRAFGMALAGAILDAILIILHGKGSNGKSTLMDVIMAAMGEYAIASAPDLLMAKGKSHPTEIADLFGARLVSCMESEDGRQLNEGLVKQLTGRDRIKARRMHENFWEFDPTHTVFLGTNHRPEVRGTDHAIWRRLKLVPFEVTIPDAEQDKQLHTKLEAELPGILRWMVEGCLEWQANGLQEPKAVTDATQGYKADMDALAQFMGEKCVIAPNAEVRVKELYTEYKHWCWENAEKELPMRKFGDRLVERGYKKESATSGPNKGYVRWIGLGLRHEGGNDPGTNGHVSLPRGEFGAVSLPDKTAQKGLDKGLDAQSTVESRVSRGKSDINPVENTRDKGYSQNHSTNSTSLPESDVEAQAPASKQEIDDTVYQALIEAGGGAEVGGLVWRMAAREDGVETYDFHASRERLKLAGFVKESPNKLGDWMPTNHVTAPKTWETDDGLKIQYRPDEADSRIEDKE